MMMSSNSSNSNNNKKSTLLPPRYVEFECAIFQAEDNDFIVGTTTRIIDLEDVCNIEQFVDSSRTTREHFTTLYFYSHTTPDMYVVVNEPFDQVATIFYAYKQFWYNRSILKPNDN